MFGLFCDTFCTCLQREEGDGQGRGDGEEEKGGDKVGGAVHQLAALCGTVRCHDNVHEEFAKKHNPALGSLAITGTEDFLEMYQNYSDL